MELRIGPAVTGSNFYRRPALIARLRRALARGNVAFLGPRRTGKTSCLEELHANPGDYVTILLNLEAHDTVGAWMSETFSPSECQLAREILKATCHAPAGLGRADFEDIHARLVPDQAHRNLVGDVLDHVLDTLKHDGYLGQEVDGAQLTRFASNILRDFWLRKTC